MVRINILLPDDLVEDFRARCAESGISMSTVVRAIIEQEMAAPAITAEKHVTLKDQRKILVALRRKGAEARRRAIVAEAMNKRPFAEIAKEFGISVSGVSKVLARAGVSVN